MAAQLQEDINKILAGDDAAHLELIAIGDLTQNQALFETVITGLIVLATSDEKTSAVPNPPAHFRIFFQLHSAKRGVVRSIEIDSTSHKVPLAKNGRQPTKLRIILRNYGTSKASNSFLSQPGDLVKISKGKAPGELRVCDLIGLFIKQQKYRYYLDPKHGSGCRYFCDHEKLLEDLGTKKWDIPGNPVQELFTRIQGNRLWHYVDLPTPAPRGQFY